MAPAEPLAEERCEAGVASVSPYADSLHQRWQKMSEVLQQATTKNVLSVVWH